MRYLGGELAIGCEIAWSVAIDVGGHLDHAFFDGVVEELILQKASAAEEAAHHRADGDVDAFGDLFVGIAVDVAEHDHEAEVDRYSFEGFEDLVREEAIGHVAFGGVAFAEVFGGFIDVVAGATKFAVENFALFDFASVFVDEGIGEDAKEPCFAVGAYLKLGEGAEGFEIGFLDEILGFTCGSR